MKTHGIGSLLGLFLIALALATSTTPAHAQVAPIVALATATIGPGIVKVMAVPSVPSSKIEFYLDGVLNKTIVPPPGFYVWYATSAAQGTHSFQAKAYAPDGRAFPSMSNILTVTVAPPPDTQAPTISLTSPAANSTVSGMVSVTASASDNTGVSKVEFYVDGVLRGTVTTSPYSYSWDATALSGTHTLLAKAYDAAGNIGTSTATTVTVANPDVLAPSAPAGLSAATVSCSRVQLSWTASTDNVAVAGYKVYRGAVQVASATSNAYLDYGLAAARTYTYAVAAYDAAGNVSAKTTAVSATTPAASSGTTKALDFAAVLHLEGQLKIPNETEYLRLNGDLKQIIDLFSEYDAKITIESEMPYVEAANKWGNNLLLYALGKGHGTGTHCDFDSMPQGDAVANYRSRKDKIDSIVGAENNLGCSGGWGTHDWAQAAYQAGFSYLDCPVMLAYLAVPEENRPINPDTGKHYTDAEISPGAKYFHDPIPPQIEDRIYPRRLKDTDDLIGDSSGIALISGSLGEISSLYEGRSSCYPGCDLTGEDTDYIFRNIDYVGSIKSESKASGLDLHFPISTISMPASKREENLRVVEDWLKRMREYQYQGKIKWRTMKEIYMDFLAASAVKVDVSSPSVPADLTAVAVSSAQIDLAWGASSDDKEVVGYNVYRNGVKIASATSNAYTDRGLAAGTTYTYAVAAYDAAGNSSALSAGASATTLPRPPLPIDATPPAVSIVSPSNGATVSGSITVLAAATDNVKVTKVELYVDGILRSSAAADALSWALDTRALPNGFHALSARAYDMAGNVGTSSAVALTVANAPAVTPPYYFIAVHAEPAAVLAQAYPLLKSMVAQADAYHIKLTLMISAPWAEHIAKSTQTLADLASWKASGHEIAAHHHGLSDEVWDGYTDSSASEVSARRLSAGKLAPEPYLGTLADYTARLRLINPAVRSGCMNDENDKTELPDAILYDTCSGYANFGEPGRRIADTLPEKGKNDFVTTGEHKGIQRKWLAHYRLAQSTAQAVSAFLSLPASSVYGSVVYSLPQEAAAFSDFLAFLHSKDPAGDRSRTLSEILSANLLSEKKLTPAAEPSPAVSVTVRPDANRTLALQTNVGAVEVSIPANSFTQNVEVTLKRPPTCPSSTSADVKASGICAEIVLDKPLQPERDSVLVFSYRDSDVSGLDKKRLILARYDEVYHGWVPLESVSDPVSNKVTGKTKHFSLFQVMQMAPGDDPNDARVYPNPFRPRLGHLQVVIDRLPAGAKVAIYTLRGKAVWKGQASDSGMVVWPGTNQDGRAVASGIYLVSVRSGGQVKILKAAVVR